MRTSISHVISNMFEICKNRINIWFEEEELRFEEVLF